MMQIQAGVRAKFKEGDRVRVTTTRMNPLVACESYMEGSEGTVIASPAGSSVVHLRLEGPEMQEVFVSQLHLGVTKKAHRGSLDGTPQDSASEPTSPLHGLGKALTGLDRFTREETPDGEPGRRGMTPIEGDPDCFIRVAHQNPVGSPEPDLADRAGSPRIDAGFDRLKRGSVET